MSSPRDIHMPLPDGGRIPRVGKLRLGLGPSRMKDGKAAGYPTAVDYFVVNEDASTNRQSAESFHAVYGDEPRELDIVLPAPHTEDVLEGAWRSYGTGGKLKRKCTGPGGDCVTRDEAGDWNAGPCQCEQEGLKPDDKKRHCQQRWTLTVMLMRVAGVGCWQLDTGSVMAAEGLTASLRMLEQFRGHLQGAKATLRVVPRQVAPEGKAKTVYICELGSLDITPQQALEIAAERVGRVTLPASSLDDEPDPLLDHETPALAAGEVVPYEPVTDPVVPAGELRKALAALTLLQRETLFEACSIPTDGSGKPEPAMPLKDVRALLCAKWDEFKLPDFGDNEPVPVTLLGAIYSARPKGSAEAFDIHIQTGQRVDPGDQIEFDEVMT